jgi:hypothetical protein
MGEHSRTLGVRNEEGGPDRVPLQVFEEKGVGRKTGRFYPPTYPPGFIPRSTLPNLKPSLHLQVGAAGFEPTTSRPPV